MDTRPPHLVIPFPSVREHDAHCGVSGSDLVIHLAALDFTSTASMKGPPSLRTASLLVDEILTDWFITLGDPLKVHRLGENACSVTPPWSQDPSALPGFCVGYVKGAARACVLHTIVTLCLDDKVSLREAPEGGLDKPCRPNATHRLVSGRSVYCWPNAVHRLASGTVVPC